MTRIIYSILFLLSLFITLPLAQARDLPLAANQIHAVGSSKVLVKNNVIYLTINNPGNDSGLKLTPPKGQKYWDLSSWKILAVDIKNISISTQLRLNMSITAGDDKRSNSLGVSVAINPGEKRTFKMLLPSHWQYAAPKGAPGPKTLNLKKTSSIKFDMRWPFEKPQKGLVNCLISNVRVITKLTPHKRMTAKQYFPFIDQYGQYIHENWPQKIHSNNDLKQNYIREKRRLANVTRPKNWDKYGGWGNGPHLKATGSFYTTKYKGKWYFVDPIGNLFWSTGIDVIYKWNNSMQVSGHKKWFVKSVRNEKKFLPAKNNLQIKYGRKNYDKEYYHDLSKRLTLWGINTIGAWSSTPVQKYVGLKNKPYVLMIMGNDWSLPTIKGGDIKFYDVWDRKYVKHMRELIPDKAKYSLLFRKSLTDPMCIGYYIDNELNFGNRHPGNKSTYTNDVMKSPANQAAKKKFVYVIERKFHTIGALNRAWNTNYKSWQDVLKSTDVPKSNNYRKDARNFFQKSVNEYFRLCRMAIKSTAPNRLYLGCKFLGDEAIKPILYKASKKYCDVLSLDIYAATAANYPLIPDMPILIGEFHIGTWGMNGRGMFRPGLCTSGISQQDRALAYKRFIQGALVNPNIVGAHWFQYHDQPLTGRNGDHGENYGVGFVDVADTPYQQLCDVARKVSENMYLYRVNGKLTNSMTSNMK